VVKPHRVRERYLEQIIVASRNAAQQIGQRRDLRRSEIGERRGMPVSQQENLKRPHGPKRDERRKALICGDDAFAAFYFGAQVIA